MGITIGYSSIRKCIHGGIQLRLPSLKIIVFLLWYYNIAVCVFLHFLTCNITAGIILKLLLRQCDYYCTNDCIIFDMLLFVPLFYRMSSHVIAF